MLFPHSRTFLFLHLFTPLLHPQQQMAMILTAFCCFLLALFLFFIAPLCIFTLLGKKNYTGNHKLPLPPGSLGWPYLGQTLQLYSQNPNLFFASKQKRYGPIFKTHILGCPCVMISSPEAAKFVLVTGAKLFKPTFPASKERMLGQEAIFFHQGPYHSKLRKLVLKAFLPDSIKSRVSSIESLALRILNSWDGRDVNTYQEMKSYTFDIALLAIFGEDQSLSKEELKQCYYVLESGYNSMPINFPGTLFHKAMKARKRIAQILSVVLAARKQQPADHPGYSDLLGSFMAPSAALTDEQIVDNIIGVIFAARDTTASVLTWIIKYLADNPDILKAVTEEQELITRELREPGEKDFQLTWADTKKMPVTSRVIQETMRMASILSFTFREAVEDVEFDGYIIPKGWKVLPLFRNIHHSPDNFKDPENFDPTRFEVAPKPNTFLPFGSGIHSCPGNELAKPEILVLLHHLTTKFRWSAVGQHDGIQYGPFALPHNGLPMRYSRKD